MAGYAVGTPVRGILTQTLLFGVGSTLLHSAACVLNDICDIDFDRQVGRLPIVLLLSTTHPSVERTKNRPLPSGIVTVFEAWVLLIALLVPAALMLLLTNRTA